MADVGNSSHFGRTQISYSLLSDAVYTVIACLAVLGNGMVIAVMLLRRRVFGSFTNRLILHQSVIDSIAGFVFFLNHVVIKRQHISVSLDGNINDQLVCRILYADSMLWWMNTTSTYNLITISLERFMATCQPVKHRNTWSVRKLKFVMGTAWGIGFVYGCHFLIVVEAHRGRCRFVEISPALKALRILLVVAIEYLVPMATLIFTYSKILFVLNRKLGNPANGPGNVMSKAKKNVLVTTMLIGTMFAVCWTPVEVLFIYQQLSGDWNSWLYNPLTGLLACNMFVNPFIYCFKYEHFRFELSKLACKTCQRNRVGERGAISIPVSAPVDEHT